MAGLNGLQVMACDIHNAYLTADCREKIWTVAGPEFGSDAGTIFIVRKALYGLNSAGATFRSLLANTLMDIGYKPT
jgi:Reverse transcriptase (RNA-dependent DNA polymerase)